MIDEATDLDAIFSTDDFAEHVTIDGVTVNAIFTKPTDMAFNDEIVATKPSLMVKSADMNGVARGASVVVRDTAYTIEKIERTGGGFSNVHLKT